MIPFLISLAVGMVLACLYELHEGRQAGPGASPAHGLIPQSVATSSVLPLPKEDPRCTMRPNSDD